MHQHRPSALVYVMLMVKILNQTTSTITRNCSMISSLWIVNMLTNASHRWKVVFNILLLHSFDSLIYLKLCKQYRIETGFFFFVFIIRPYYQIRQFYCTILRIEEWTRWIPSILGARDLCPYFLLTFEWPVLSKISFVWDVDNRC